MERPGRIGTSSPDLSFGSHMFQDLVEADILYIACMDALSREVICMKNAEAALP